MCGIPSSAVPSPGATEILHFMLISISFLVSILHVTRALFWQALVSNLMKVTDFILPTFEYLTFTESKFLPLSSYFL